jgi:hypothetical protein
MTFPRRFPSVGVRRLVDSRAGLQSPRSSPRVDFAVCVRVSCLPPHCVCSLGCDLSTRLLYVALALHRRLLGVTECVLISGRRTGRLSGLGARESTAQVAGLGTPREGGDPDDERHG